MGAHDDVDAPWLCWQPAPRWRTARSPTSSRRARRDAALELIAEGADVNAAQGDGTTPLHWATYKLDLELVQLFARPRREGGYQNHYGATPLGEAVKSAHVPLTEALLDAGRERERCQRRRRDGADARGPHRLRRHAKLLLEHGADVNARELWREQTALMWAADGAFAELTQLLARPRRRRPRTCGCERLGCADHVRAAGAVPPHRRHDGPAVRRAFRLRRLRARDPRRRRGHRSADARRRDGVDDRDRQLGVRHGQSVARRGRESSLSPTGGGARRSTSPST